MSYCVFFAALTNLPKSVLMDEISQKSWDVAIVGAGAAGLMASIICGQAGLRVLLLDGQPKVGAKILMSGGTRCNVTNHKVTENDFFSESPRFVRNVLRAFPSGKALSFFQDFGVSFVQEEGGKYFPSTHSGKTILEALLRGVSESGVNLQSNSKVTNIKKENGIFEITGDAFSYFAKTVILCCGGLSYPTTGSDGIGYQLANQMDHTVLSTTPALTPLLTPEPAWHSLSGLTLNCRLILLEDHKELAREEGSFLFTHLGFSGPIALNISRHWIRAKSKKSLQLVANFLPHVHEAELRKRIQEDSQANPTRYARRILSERIPDRLARVLFDYLGIADDIPVSQFRREDREDLIKLLMHCPLPVSGVIGYQKAEVTAGGVPLSELDYRTMASQKVPGLFFAGEMLDVDGRIGGFNFQWAWSSGYVAAHGVINFIKASSGTL